MRLLILALLVLTPLAAAAEEQDPYKGLPLPPDFQKRQPASLEHLWSLGGVLTPVTAGKLLARVDEATKESGAATSTTDLLSIQSDLAAQVAALKKAYVQSLASSDQPSVDTLYSQVIDGAAAADPVYLKIVADQAEALYLTLGKLIDSQFLAATPGGIPRYGSPIPSGTQPIAQAVEREHLAAYRKTCQDLTANLRKLLDLGASKK
jgi:hypothetical protein